MRKGLDPEYHQILGSMMVRASTILGWTRAMEDCQDVAPSSAYDIAGMVKDMGVEFFDLANKYQIAIKSYELQRLNEMADEKFNPQPDETSTGSGEHKNEVIASHFDKPSLDERLDYIARQHYE